MDKTAETVYEKNPARRIAAAALAVVIVMFTLIGLNRSVAAQAEKTAALFDSRTGIAAQLQERVNAARGLCALASGRADMQDAFDALRTAYNALYDAQSVHDKYVANAALGAAWETLWVALDGAELDEADREQAGYYADMFSNAQRCIDTDGYNDAVAAFNADVMQTPVARLLRGVIRVQLPEAFA